MTGWGFARTWYGHRSPYEGYEIEIPPCKLDLSEWFLSSCFLLFVFLVSLSACLVAWCLAWKLLVIWLCHDSSKVWRDTKYCGTRVAFQDRAERLACSVFLLYRGGLARDYHGVGGCFRGRVAAGWRAGCLLGFAGKEGDAHLGCRELLGGSTLVDVDG